MTVERATDGRALYEASRDYQGWLVVQRNLLAAGGGPWEELSWDDQDLWERMADELNEARREPQDA